MVIILTSHGVSQKSLKHIIQSLHSHLSIDPMPKEVVSRDHSALSLPLLRTMDRESCMLLTGVHSGTSVAENSFAGTSPEKNTQSTTQQSHSQYMPWETLACVYQTAAEESSKPQ